MTIMLTGVDKRLTSLARPARVGWLPDRKAGNFSDGSFFTAGHRTSPPVIPSEKDSPARWTKSMGTRNLTNT